MIAVRLVELPKPRLITIPVQNGVRVDEEDPGMLVQPRRDLHIGTAAHNVGIGEAVAVRVVVARQKHGDEHADVGRGSEDARLQQVAELVGQLVHLGCFLQVASSPQRNVSGVVSYSKKSVHIMKYCRLQ